MKLRFYYSLILFGLNLLLPIICFAEERDPFDNGTCDGCPPAENAPIDSWLVVLLIAGALYGYLKYRKMQPKAI